MIDGRQADEGRARQSMQHISETYFPNQSQLCGGRVTTDAYLQSFELSAAFEGLEEGADRYELLLLVKKIGNAACFTPRMIQLLDYYMAFTRDQDWEEGSRPIVYQSVYRTALDLGVSERQIQKLERSLSDIGAVTWNDSGNHRRYGQRDPRTGRILFAFGIDLSPLAAMKTELENKLAEKQAYDDQWMETKRQISWYRSQIRGNLLRRQEQGAGTGLINFQSRYDEIAVQIRSHMKLNQLHRLLAEHKALYSDISDSKGVDTVKLEEATQRPKSRKETHECSSKSEQKFVHYKSTTQESSVKTDTGSPAGKCLQRSVVAATPSVDPFRSSGIDHIKLEMAIGAVSERFQAFLPSDPTWSDLVEAAYRLRTDLGISQESWGRGCDLLGRTGAALCILITDRARHRDTDPVRSPAAYFNGMLKRASDGDLHLHKSIFGFVSQAA